MLADLPGYGYAQGFQGAGRRMAEADLRLSARARETCAASRCLIDARRGVMDTDREVMELLDQAAVSYRAGADQDGPAEARERAKAEADIAR